MTTLLQAQKNVNLVPVVNVTIGGTAYNGKVGRYKYREKADSFGRASIWLDNTGGVFDDLSSTPITRGAEVVLSRGVKTSTGQELTADLPSVWIESMIYTLFRDQPYLVLDCIDWVGRLRYFRYASETTWTGQLIETIVSDLLANVGLTLSSGSFSTALSIDYTITRKRSAWTALRAVMSKVPEVLYAKTGGEIGWKTLDPDEVASYDFNVNPSTTSDDHPLLDDSDVAEGSPRYNSITVAGGSSLEFTGTAEDATEISLMGYRRRRYITDRSLGSDAQCAERAQAELDFWLARGQAGVIVARPHFTARLFDVVSAPAPLWGGPAVGAGHITRIVEWFNYGSQDYAQALTIGEVPDAAITAIGDDTDPIPVNDDDPDDADAGSGDESGATDEDEGIDTSEIADGAITSDKIADDSISNAKMQNDSIGAAEIQAGAVGSSEIAAGAVGTSELAADAVTSAKIADDSIGNEHMQNDAITAAEIAAGAVDTSELATDAVTSAKIADNSIGNEHMQNDAITAAEIQAGAVGSSEIAAGAVDTSELAADAVTSAKIADDQVDSEHIAAGAVDAEHFAELPTARVYHSSTQSINDEVETFLSFNSERWDTDAIHNTSTNNGRLTCKTAGRYLVTAHISFDYASQGSGTAFARVDIVQGSSTIVATQTATRLSTIDEDLQITISAIVDLSVSSYLRVRVYQAGGFTVDVKAGSSANRQNADFEMHFLGGT